ncbi:MAG: ATP-binding cassette domain-containing protein [Verrucomicrobia bacterium]|nr:ATP-binding cassette domain-containing protein [Verrucomicrobiota bacterium]
MNAPTQPLLNLKNLRVWYPIRRGILSHTVGHVRAVDGVSLHIAPGETLALVGESGCGKTTLARAILGLEPVRDGSIAFQGRDITRASNAARRPIRPDLQVVFQDPFASLNPRMTVMDIITEGLIRHARIKPRERESEALRLLADVGLGRDALHRYPHEFSGGQRQRICVARAVSLHPKLIICDEPVSALDVSVQAQVLNLLMDLRDKYGLAYLFITHDLGVVRTIAHRTAVMYLGQLVETGPTESVISSPRHPYTRALISAIPRAGKPRTERVVLTGDVPPPANPPAGCRFHPRCPHAIDQCRTTIPPLESTTDPTRQVACIRQSEI